MIFKHIETVLILTGLQSEWRLRNRVFERFPIVAECLLGTCVVSFLKACWQIKMIEHLPAVTPVAPKKVPHQPYQLSA